MKKLLIITLLISSMSNAQTPPYTIAQAYQWAYPTILGGQLGISISANDLIKIDNTIISPVGSSYTYQVTDVITGETRTLQNFNSTQFRLIDLPNPIGFLRTNRTYAVRVRINGNPSYPNFGNTCIVTTRPLIIRNSGGNNLVPQGGIISSGNDQIQAVNNSPYNLSTSSLNSGLVFRINRNGADTFYITTPVSASTLLLRNNVYGQLPATYFVDGSVYCVDVAIVNPDQTWGSFTDNVSACFTFSAPVNKMSSDFSAPLFDVIASPNPTKESFNLEFKGSSESPIEIQVVDMQGRSVETISFSLEEFNQIEFGKKYIPGVYNITILQDNEQKLLRLIKE